MLPAPGGLMPYCARWKREPGSDYGPAPQSWAGGLFRSVRKTPRLGVITIYHPDLQGPMDVNFSWEAPTISSIVGRVALCVHTWNLFNFHERWLRIVPMSVERTWHMSSRKDHAG
jgi:hypothetical protein